MILADAFRTEPKSSVTWTPMDDRWYQSGLGLSSSSMNVTGLYLSPETMFRCSTVLAAVRFLAISCALCPAQVMRKTKTGRETIPDHYAQRVLRNPNARDTDFEWMEQNLVWAAVWGASYNRIVPGQEWQLQPLPPWEVKVVDAAADGSLIYKHTPRNGGPPKVLTSDEVLHFRGTSLDNINGAEMFNLMQNAVGIAMLTEKHLGTFLRKGARLGGILSPDNPITVDQEKTVQEQWAAQSSGPDKTGTVAMLPFGFKFNPFSSSNKDAEIVAISDRQVAECLRFLGVPGVVVGYADKTATYASAKEFFESGGIKHCILPWLRRFERRIDKALIFEPDVFVKYNLDVLLRANTKERYASLFQATGRPFMTGNEARAIEDLNESEDSSMDEVLRPVNLTTDDLDAAAREASADQPRRPTPFESPNPPDAAMIAEDVRQHVAAERSRQFVIDAATRVVRREIGAVMDRVSLAARDHQAWRAWVADYYGRLVPDVARNLHVSDETAAAYAMSHRDALLKDGVAAAEKWEAEEIPRLVKIAFGEAK